MIVRTAAEGASAEDVERDLVFLQKLWKSIQDRAKNAKPPTLVYQESELPLGRHARPLHRRLRACAGRRRACVQASRRVPEEDVAAHGRAGAPRYKEKAPLFESFGVDDEIRSTLNRRVDLPSGGYLIFDYAEAFTVIDVNTGRFVGSRSKSSGARLEDTITKNNLEAVKEVVRQLRLRDIGGIIVIDFIDMANPSNRQTVEEALRSELERDRTKTYVVEISPLGLVEMTRQNVTDGPREILTKKCPTCHGDGIVVSETTAAVELERGLRALAASKPRTKAFKVEVAAKPGSLLIGADGARLVELEANTKRRFFFELTDGIHNDHFVVLDEGTIEKLTPESPIEEGLGARAEARRGRPARSSSAVAKVDGLAVNVAHAGKLVGKKVKARVNRVLDGPPTRASSTSSTSKARSRPSGRPRSRRAPRGRRPPPLRQAGAGEGRAEAEAAGEAVAGGGRGRGPKPRRRPRRRRRRRRRGAARAAAAAAARRRRRPRRRTARRRRGRRSTCPDASSARPRLPRSRRQSRRSRARTGRRPRSPRSARRAGARAADGGGARRRPRPRRSRPRLRRPRSSEGHEERGRGGRPTSRSAPARRHARDEHGRGTSKEVTSVVPRLTTCSSQKSWSAFASP